MIGTLWDIVGQYDTSSVLPFEMKGNAYKVQINVESPHPDPGGQGISSILKEIDTISCLPPSPATNQMLADQYLATAARYLKQSDDLDKLSKDLNESIDKMAVSIALKLARSQPQPLLTPTNIAYGTGALIGVMALVLLLKRTEPRPGLLRGFRWFLPRDQREDVDHAIADLKKDAREMRKEGRTRLFIHTVITWRSLTTLATILFGGVKGWLIKLSAIAVVLKKLGF